MFIGFYMILYQCKVPFDTTIIISYGFMQFHEVSCDFISLQRLSKILCCLWSVRIWELTIKYCYSEKTKTNTSISFKILDADDVAIARSTLPNLCLTNRMTWKNFWTWVCQWIEGRSAGIRRSCLDSFCMMWHRFYDVLCLYFIVDLLSIICN